MKQGTEMKDQGLLARAFMRIVGALPFSTSVSPDPGMTDIGDVYEARVHTSARGASLPYRLFVPGERPKRGGSRELRR